MIRALVDLYDKAEEELMRRLQDDEDNTKEAGEPQNSQEHQERPEATSYMLKSPVQKLQISDQVEVELTKLSPIFRAFDEKLRAYFKQ